MELILLQKVRNLGTLGDKVNVKPGYGRNFLLPQGKAVRANAVNLAAFEERRTEYEAKANTALDEAQARQARFADVTVTLSAHASAEGKLFGSVNPRDIAAALTEAGHPTAKGEVILSEGPLRNVGEYTVALNLHADVHASVKVIVVGDN